MLAHDPVQRAAHEPDHDSVHEPGRLTPGVPGGFCTHLSSHSTDLLLLITDHWHFTQIGAICHLFEQKFGEIGSGNARASVDPNPANAILAGVWPLGEHGAAYYYPVQ